MQDLCLDDGLAKRNAFPFFSVMYLLSQTGHLYHSGRRASEQKALKTAALADAFVLQAHAAWGQHPQFIFFNCMRRLRASHFLWRCLHIAFELDDHLDTKF